MEYIISKESDEVVEMFCEHCYEHGNKNQSAEGFCVDCVKYFCATCLRYHRTFLPDHVTQDKDSMPVDVYLEKCKQHPEEIVKFYCLSCEEAACTTCKTAFHKHCEDIHHLPKLAAGFDTGKECSDLEHALGMIEKKVAGIELIIGNGKQKVEQYNTDAKNTLRKQKEEVEIIFNNFEQEIVQIHNANKNQIDIEENTKELLKADIKNIKTGIEELKNSPQKCKIFLETKRMKEENKQINEKLGGVKMHLEQNMCKYRYRLATKRVKPESFVRVIVEPQKVVKFNKIPWSIILFVLVLSVIIGVLMLRRNTHITMEKLSDIKVSFLIRQMCYLSEDSLLILEYLNKEVHVYSPKDSNWLYTLYLENLTDITRVGTDKIAAIFFGNVELWSISDTKWSVIQHIKVGKNCRLTQYRPGKLFVMCLESRKYTINIFDDNENKLQSFTIEALKLSSFTVSPDGKTIYFSSYKEGSITCYTTEGKFIAKYKNESLQGTWRMTVDSMGNLFVCGSSSNNIFYISADLTNGYEILNEDHGIHRPYSITYNERDNILCVSSGSKSPIQVFKIKTPRFPYFL